MKIVIDNLLELKQNYKWVIGSIGILVLSQFTLQYKEIIWPKLYMIIACVAFVLILSFSRINDPKKIASNGFLIIFIFGICNSLILPIRYNLDENTHYYRAVQIADGKLRIQADEPTYLTMSPDFSVITSMPSKAERGDSLNTNLYSKDFLSVVHKKTNYSNKLVDKAEINNPAYIPSALGIVFGRLISNKIYVSYYLGRIFNVLTYALLAFLAMRKSKKYKLQLFSVATIPFTLWISAGFSYDSLYYGLILLIVSQFTNFLSSDGSITVKKGFLYCLTCLGLVFCKAPTILLMGLLIILPQRFYANKKTRLVNLVSVGISMLIGLLWLGQKIILQLLHLINASGNTSSPGIADRLQYFFVHPQYTIDVFLRSFSDVISNLGAAVQLPQPYLMAHSTIAHIGYISLIIIFVMVSYQLELKLNWKLTITIVGLFITITVGVFLAITGDPRVFKLGDLFISGVQGRYHFYMLAFLPLLLSVPVKRLFIGKNDEKLIFDGQNIISFVVKTVLFVTLLNTCVGLFGYL